MQKKLTITLDERVVRRAPQRRGASTDQSFFIESLVRPHVVEQGLDAAYCRMSGDEEREAEASAWVDGTSGDAGDGAR